MGGGGGGGRVWGGGGVGGGGAERGVHGEKGKRVDVELALTSTAGAGSATASASGTASVAPTGTVTTPGPNLGLVIAGAGVALAGVAAGIGLVVVSGDKKTEADTLRQSLIDKKVFRLCQVDKSDPDCQRFVDAGNLGQTLGNVGAPLIAGAGLVGVATVIYYVIARPSRSAPPPVKAGVTVGPNGGSLVVQGNF